MLTDAQLHEIRAIVQRHHAAVVANVIGPKALPPEVLADVERAGLLSPIGDSIEDAYLYGVLLAALEDPSTREMGLADLRAYLRANPVPLTERERRAVELAEHRAAQHIMGLGNRIEQETGALLIEADQALRVELEEVVREELAENILRRETIAQLKSNLGHRSKDWTRDWVRIAVTEKHDALQEGKAQQLRKEHGADVFVAKIPQSGACEACLKLHLDESGKPRIFKLSELEANGTNVGRARWGSARREPWRAVVGSTHPFCACLLIRVPEGWGFDEEGDLVPPGLERSESTGELRKSLVIRTPVKPCRPQPERFVLIKAQGGPFIGPRGGKWANAQHTIPWHEGTRAWARRRLKEATKYKAMPSKQLVKVRSRLASTMSAAKKDGRQEDYKRARARYQEASREVESRRDYYTHARRAVAAHESERTGKLALHEEDIAQLLANPGDAYRDAGLKSPYEYRPDLFRTSDLSGKKVRHYVKLPDGRIAHPDEIHEAKRRERLLVMQEADAPAVQWEEEDPAHPLTKGVTTKWHAADSLAGQRNVRSGSFLVNTTKEQAKLTEHQRTYVNREAMEAGITRPKRTPVRDRSEWEIEKPDTVVHPIESLDERPGASEDIRELAKKKRKELEEWVKREQERNHPKSTLRLDDPGGAP